jgi:amino acid transporter
MTGLIVGILLLCGISGLINGAEVTVNSTSSGSVTSSAGAAMIFVLLTYGGWNEGVYLSAEVKDVKRNMSRILLIGLAIITVLYVLINGAYLHTLGLEQLRSSDTIGVALTNEIIGTKGSFAMAVIVIISALSTANATIITGARTNYALGRDFSLLGYIGKWNSSYNAPINALLVQGGISFALVILGAFTQEAVSTMVDYTAPVFWFFILLTTCSLFIFRRTEDSDGQHFTVPFYPLTPILFIIACCYLLYSSVMFTGAGALVGIGILILGLPVYLAARSSHISQRS